MAEEKYGVITDNEVMIWLRAGLAAVLVFYNVQPGPLLIEKLKLKLTTKAEH